jgi:hypothetical protein
MTKTFIKLIFLSLLLVTFAVQTLCAQEPPFFNDIQKFKKQDSVSFPPKNAILFIGSSSFTKWTDVQSYFPDYPIINRGFGSSTLPDLIRYTNDIIIPYQPKQVVIYCGDNDLAKSDSITPRVVLNRFKELFHLVRKQLPATNITFISIKPSPSREKLMPKMKQANALVRSFLAKQKNTTFINTFQPMLLNNGKPNPAIFLEDNLHLNSKKDTQSGRKQLNQN